MSYRPEQSAAPTDFQAIGEDFVRCTLTVNASDTRYWQASIIDGMYVCTSTTDPTDTCVGADDTTMTESQEPSSDWAVPWTDEYSIYHDPWCTPASTLGQTELDHNCSQITCIMERVFDTGDAANDYAFAPPDASTPDNLIVREGRAKLRINPTDFPTAITNSDVLTIPVYTSALYGLSTSLATAALALVLSN